jgi:hypothetical protein
MRLQPGHNPGLTFAIHHQASVIFFLAPGPSWAQGDLSLRDILTRPNLAQQQFPIFHRAPARCRVRFRSQGVALSLRSTDIPTIAKLKYVEAIFSAKASTWPERTGDCFGCPFSNGTTRPGHRHARNLQNNEIKADLEKMGPSIKVVSV